jgi:hypothetical protein
VSESVSAVTADCLDEVASQALHSGVGGSRAMSRGRERCSTH